MTGIAARTHAQTPPKRELRAAWIATVANIDWPSRPGLPADEQKAEYIRLLDMLKRNGMNAVVVQVRPAADALYASDLEPWSYWLTGKQGDAPSPYYDPLQFMITETHKRGMEFHAWFNPYRAVFRTSMTVAPNHITRLRPQWFVTYGDTRYFNPGIPEVWTFVTRVIRDVVRRYDIDAVHFDDYFYPYRIRGKEFPDYRTYRTYGKDMSLDAWRRHNVDTVIRMLSKAIKEEKPWVKFGISPFGVWRNRDSDPRGSDTQASTTNYDDLYADILLWLKKGWIDYITPQLYWEFGHPTVAYETLVDWWAHHTYGRDLYIGQALYRIGSSRAWRNPAELPNQIKANRTYPEVKGSIYFSATSFYKNTLGFDDTLRNHLYRYPAIPPAMPWLDSIPPLPPRITGARKGPDGLHLLWQDGDTSRQTYQYVVYRYPGNVIGNLNDPRYILSVVGKDNTPDTAHIQTFTDRSYRKGQPYIYFITALDRLHNESLLSNKVYIRDTDE
ncbi:glycoside hydrolase family 10 protein [Compostibacter hankyongensis]|uniref:Glycoside hydrolase family 10 protein n=2 Tax=Compostibacter hankyongensis TaxID=1007089 RepID=A0ABP8G0D4_9BACT